MGPLLLKPFYLSPIWGGPRIAQARGIPWTEADNHGESFDVSAHPSTMGVVLNGPCAGMTLAEAIDDHREEILGDVPDDTPIQVVFMDPIQTLSVQVHPDEAYAQAAEGDHGKVEAWYVIDADPGATLIAGCTTDDLDALRAAAADDTIGELYGQRIQMHAGDFILIPPGTLHALGAGIFAVEIGSLGNTTYRICDWGRGRTLHVDKAFDVLDTASQPSVVRLGSPRDAVADQERLGVDTGFYQSFVVDVASRMEFACNGRYAVITCVDGTARVQTPQGSVTLGATQSCLIPACAKTYAIEGSCRVLRSIRTPA